MTNERPKVHQARVVRRPSGVPSAIDGFAALGQIVDAAREFGAIYQTEHTKRAQLSAYENTEIARIKAAEGVLRGYFEQVFVERRSNFEELFSRLDTALEDKNGEAVNSVLRGIVDIARTSPLADLGDLSQIRAALDDPDHTFEL
jgi:hypothetical protein